MYAIARLSAVRMIVDTIEEQGWADQVEYYEFDAHADNVELPQKDLIGLVAFSSTQNDGFHDITFGVVIMTYDDAGLIRSTTYTDVFYRRLEAHKKFPMFLPDGTPTDFEAVCFDGTSASPMSRVDVRPTADIQVSARVTRAGAPP